jgi:type IV pilus assembly protein PilM
MAFDLSKLSSFFSRDTVPPSEGVVGVDVGSSSIKIVELHNNNGVATLTTYGELQLGPYDNTDIGRAVRLPPHKLIAAFVDILREATSTAHQVAVAVSYNSSFSTILTVPEVEREKITALIPIEARKYVPVPLADVTIDWFPVSGRSEKGTRILLAAIHNDALARYEGMVKGANLSRIAEEIELFSTIRTAVNPTDKTVAIIDFGAGSTKLSLVHGGIVSKSHSVPMNGMDLTNAIAKVKGIDFKTAEEMKRAEGFGIVAGNSALEKEFVTILERGFREMHTVIKRYETDEGNPVEKIILTGGGALFNGILPYTKDMLSYPVEIADPFSKVAYPAFLEDTLKEAGPSFAVAVGVALRGLSARE